MIFVLNEQVLTIWLGVHTTLVFSENVSIKQRHDKF